MKKGLLILLSLLLLGLPGFARGQREESPEPSPGGRVVFTANGEDFVRRGLVDKEGWRVTFDKLLVHLVDPTAYTPSGAQQVVLAGAHWVDLAAGNTQADPIVVGTVRGVEAGNYQSLKFSLKRGVSGAFKGYSIVMIGQAFRAGETVDFIIKLDEEMDFDGREGYVGDQIKGLLTAGGSTCVEMTFHFDHIFGDREADRDSHINTESVGFDFFNRFARDGRLQVAQADLREASDYPALVRAIWTLGHLGEGHCQVSHQSSREEI